MDSKYLNQYEIILLMELHSHSHDQFSVVYYNTSYSNKIRFRINQKIMVLDAMTIPNQTIIVL